MTPTELPQGSPSRLQRARKALVWVSVFVGALALLLFPSAAEHRLNQAWLALTTDWFWPESVTRPAYQVDSTRIPDFALSSWSNEEAGTHWSSPAHGQLDFGMTGFTSPVDYRLLTVWRQLQPPVAVLEPPATDTFYWQPSRAGYKPLIHQTSTGTLLDASFVAASGHHQWRWRPGVQYESSAQHWPADWRGAVVLLEFAVPQPVRHSPGSGADFTLKSEHSLGIQWVREVWALTQGLYLVTPWWLTLTAAFALVLPWVLVNTLKSAVLASALFAGVWTAANWALVLMLQWWLPLWPIIASVLVAIMWLLRQRKRSAVWLELMSGYRSLASQRVEHLLSSGQLEAAQKLLLTSPWLSQEHDAIYKVAQGFERKRQYQAALDCYQHLCHQNPDYRDAAQRYQALMAMTDPKTQWQGDATVRTMVAPAALEQPEIGRYRLLKELGRGAMGVVYEAVDPKIERPVALKVVNLDVLGQDAAEDIKKRFYREARAAGCLNHPNIVTVFDVGEESDLAYIAMDLIRGVSLQQHLAKNADIQLGQLCEWLAQAAEALDYAHNNGIIHRDIKPANLLLDERSGELKVSDFGVARVAGSDQTATGIILGSPNYMSPEQIKGEELTPQTDIYSLGVTLYRALAGRLPFQGDTLPALAYAVLHEQQESPRRFNASVTPALVRIVNRAMQKNPAERYATAGEMAQALHRRVKAD